MFLCLSFLFVQLLMFDQYILEVEKLLAEQGPFLFDQDLLGLKGELLIEQCEL